MNAESVNWQFLAREMMTSLEGERRAARETLKWMESAPLHKDHVHWQSLTRLYRDTTVAILDSLDAECRRIAHTAGADEWLEPSRAGEEA